MSLLKTGHHFHFSVKKIIIIIFCLVAIGTYVSINYDDLIQQDEVSDNPFDDTDSNELLFIKKHEKDKKPKYIPNGVYIGEYEYKGNRYHERIFFGSDNTIYFELVNIDDGEDYSGKAKWRLKGSVLKYSMIKGDHFIFNPRGNYITLPKKSILIFHFSEEEEAVYIKKKSHKKLVSF